MENQLQRGIERAAEGGDQKLCNWLKELKRRRQEDPQRPRGIQGGLKVGSIDWPESVRSRILRACERAGVYTVKQLAMKSPEFLQRKIPNFGPKSMKQVRTYLAAHGYSMDSKETLSTKKAARKVRLRVKKQIQRLSKKLHEMAEKMD